MSSNFKVERAAGVIFLTLMTETPHSYVLSEPKGEGRLGPITILPATDSLEDARSHLAQVRLVAKKFLKCDNPSEMYLSVD